MMERIVTAKNIKLMSAAWLVLTISLALGGVLGSSDLECKRFDEVFRDGRELCESIYGDAFEYVPRSSFLNYELAYTMWFFTDSNPNDATTIKRRLTLQHDFSYANTDVCHLRSPGVTAHKQFPSAENASTFSECHPYRHNACCEQRTVENAETIKQLYEGRHRWDACGSLSPQCERFFIQEQCFYECDPNAGLFRRYPPKAALSDPNYREWELYKLPVKGDYCDAWFTACRQDRFCSAGSVFECARVASSEDDDQPEETPSTSSPSSTSSGAIIAIAVLSVLLVLTCLSLCCTFKRIYASRRTELENHGTDPKRKVVAVPVAQAVTPTSLRRGGLVDKVVEASVEV